MIDFKEEIKKYKPIMNVDDVQDTASEEVSDIMALLQRISEKSPDTGE